MYAGHIIIKYEFLFGVTYFHFSTHQLCAPDMKQALVNRTDNNIYIKINYLTFFF